MAGKWETRSTALLLCLLLVAGVVIARGISVGEFSYNVDETQHAVTGLYFADLVRDHPFSNPVEYTYRYYAQYPALSGIIHWPPLFYCFEGLAFLILGPTVISARLTIAGFAIAGIIFWFLLVRELLDDWAAAFAAAVLALLPSILLFEKTVMLEIPSLTWCLAATFFWVSYLRYGKQSQVYWCAICSAAALLTKQNSIYLVVFFVLSGILQEGWRLLKRQELWLAAGVGIVLTAPFYVLVYLVHWKTIAMDLNEPNPGFFSRWLFYPAVLPVQVGWILLGISVLGIVTCGFWDSSRTRMIMLSWLVACYVTLTLIGHKEARYSIYWIPPIVYFATGLIFYLVRRPSTRVIAAIGGIGLLGATVAAAWTFHRPYIDGYSVVAERILHEPNSGVVLYDGPLPGNFIFFMRADDPARRFVILRKALYAYQIKASGASVEIVHNEDDIEELFRQNGVRFIVVSKGVPFNFSSQAILRDLLKPPVYKELGQFPILGDDLTPAHSSLILYENLNWVPPTTKTVRVRMLTLDHDITVPWDSFPAFQTK